MSAPKDAQVFDIVRREKMGIVSLKHEVAGCNRVLSYWFQEKTCKSLAPVSSSSRTTARPIIFSTRPSNVKLPRAKKSVVRRDHIADKNAKRLAIGVDAKGVLRFQKNEVDGDHVVLLVTDRVGVDGPSDS